jgi:multiple sugar transport system permease protein
VNSQWWFAVGTLSVWAGWSFAIRALVGCVKYGIVTPGLNRPRVLRGLAVSAFVAALLFIIGNAFSATFKSSAPAPFRFPLVWVVMPFAGWLVTVSAVMVAARLLQAGLALNDIERWSRAKAAVFWLVTGAAGVVLYRMDSANKVNVLRGGIPFQTTTAAALICVVLAATAAMVFAGKEATSRGMARSVVSQIALISGSVVFGIPFVFLLITSFKEPEEMSSPNGIVWIPKVSETIPYYDKKDPEFSARFQGNNVVGHIISTNPDGTVQLDILRPHGLSGTAFATSKNALHEVARDAPVVSGTFQGVNFTGAVIEEMEDGRRRVSFLSPPSLTGRQQAFAPADLRKVKHDGLNWRNYPDALEYLPPEANGGLVYLKNTLIIVILSVVGTIISSAIVAYAFSRMSFPGKNALFAVLLSTMMLPAAVTLLPTFLIFRDLHAIDTLYPLWVPAFFGSAFNIFLLRQFFMQIPMELEDAAKIDGCTYLKTFWAIMLPQIKPALAVIAIWTFMGAWNNFMGPLIYISSPENMPLSYALQLFQGDRGGDEPGLVMAFATMCMIPVLALFFSAQRYFIEGVTLSGLGGR